MKLKSENFQRNPSLAKNKFKLFFSILCLGIKPTVPNPKEPTEAVLFLIRRNVHQRAQRKFDPFGRVTRFHGQWNYPDPSLNISIFYVFFPPLFASLVDAGAWYLAVWLGFVDNISRYTIGGNDVQVSDGKWTSKHDQRVGGCKMYGFGCCCWYIWLAVNYNGGRSVYCNHNYNSAFTAKVSISCTWVKHHLVLEYQIQTLKIKINTINFTVTNLSTKHRLNCLS